MKAEYCHRFLPAVSLCALVSGCAYFEPTVALRRKSTVSGSDGLLPPPRVGSWGDDRALRTPWHETVVYEVHVKGFTRQHPLVP